jgi:hypothetical protein
MATCDLFSLLFKAARCRQELFAFDEAPDMARGLVGDVRPAAEYFTPLSL